MTRIHATAIIERGAQIADGASIGPYSVIGAEVRIAAGVSIGAHVALSGRTMIGAGTQIFPFAAIGGPPQYVGHDSAEPTELVIGERNVIRESVTMNRGTMKGGGKTVVGSDGYFMSASHIGHDCHVGNHVVMANCATLGGHVTLGDHVVIGGLSAVHQRCRIGAYAMVGGKIGISGDVPPFTIVNSVPGQIGGLNVVGLERCGFKSEEITLLRRLYRDLFVDTENGTFRERLAVAARDYAHHVRAMEMIDFLSADADRPLTRPQLRNGK